MGVVCVVPGLFSLCGAGILGMQVAAAHKQRLELTVHNCDVALDFIRGMEESCKACTAVTKARQERMMTNLADLQLDAHREHLEFFRMLYLAIGNLIYRKEKKLESVDRRIQTSHIQLEVCVHARRFLCVVPST